MKLFFLVSFVSLYFGHIVSLELLVDSNNGTDAGNCLTGGPNACKTLAYAIQVAKENDQIRIVGSFNPQNTIQIQKPLYIYASPEPATINCSNEGQNAGLETVISISTQCGLENLIITGCTGPAIFVNSGNPNAAETTLVAMDIHHNVQGIKTIQSKLRVENSKIHNNVGAMEGAGIYAIQSQVILYRTHIYFNVAKKDGGGISSMQSHINMYYSDIVDNYAVEGDGGAILAHVSQTFVWDSDFSRNEAGGSGGAIYAIDGTVNFTDCNFTYNIAADSGGGLYLMHCTVMIFDCMAPYNKAVGGSGGSFYIDKSSTMAYRLLASYNFAGFSGGSFYIDKGTSIFWQLSADFNTASQQGGALFLEKGTTIIYGGHQSGQPCHKHCTYNYVSINNNTALSGGAIHTHHATVVIYNSTIDNNSATGRFNIANGGGIESIESTVITYNTTMRYNTAQRQGMGGGIHLTKSSLAMMNVTFVDNAFALPLLSSQREDVVCVLSTAALYGNPDTSGVSCSKCSVSLNDDQICANTDLGDLLIPKLEKTTEPQIYENKEIKEILSFTNSLSLADSHPRPLHALFHFDFVVLDKDNQKVNVPALQVNDDGTYTLPFEFFESGEYTFYIQYDGLDVSQSPVSKRIVHKNEGEKNVVIENIIWGAVAVLCALIVMFAAYVFVLVRRRNLVNEQYREIY
eukprot:CAMPEP_0174254392 /NCGR_PEP_ID=MMETSP0439-20130205/3726_1 /TAXON_ID=0 /ORGANISM="Stereomyxa ramosa, Strain Chinc5" /LENGTH=686 /DNA_ID=CAMNT_0015335953 /DNA_START=10 /DNA_END=2070 /DNA_ORIENTATION=-